MRSWNYDEAVRRVAQNVYPGNLQAAAQYPGRNDRALPAGLWESVGEYVVGPANQPFDDRIEAILASGRKQEWIVFLLRVGRWGNMLPGPLGASFQRIFHCRCGAVIGKSRIDSLEKAIQDAARALNDHESPEKAWNILTGQSANLTSVMSSKLLHFLARSVGRVDPIPVPIDNAMVRQSLWPEFRRATVVRNLPWPRPNSVLGDSWASYNRYMTAIRTWAEIKNKTCQEVENSLFRNWRDGGIQFWDVE